MVHRIAADGMSIAVRTSERYCIDFAVPDGASTGPHTGDRTVRGRRTQSVCTN
jgi:hypothetical protein